jgi:hypothetical protein
MGEGEKMKTVIEMAREAEIGDSHGYMIRNELSNLERFAELVRADEREACAKVCDDLPAPDYVSPDDVTVWDVATLDCGDAIRARGNT